MKKKIEDFGEKIEGARKDVAALRKGLSALTASMAEDWNEEEREKYITKDLVWKKPDYQKMYEEGTDRKLLYYIKTVRDALPAKPKSNSKKNQDGYIEFVSEIRDRSMAMKDFSDAERFMKGVTGKYLEKRYGRSYALKAETYGCFNNKLLRAVLHQVTDLEINQKEFLYNENEKLQHRYIRTIVHYKPNQDLYVDWNVRANGKEEGKIKIQSDIMNWNIHTVLNLDKNIKSSDFINDTYFVISRKGELVGFNLPTKEDAVKCAVEFAKECSKDPDAVSLKTKAKNSVSSKKTKLLPPQLEHIKREGVEYRANNKNVSGEDIIDKFGLRGGQFGNWTNQKDRQASMNMLYDAFCDLAVALDIPYDDVSLKRSDDSRTAALGIAFGARGHSSALAHFESAENVINLTKMKGAGSLAHEWGHALDCFIKKELELIPSPYADIKQRQMATHCKNNNNPTVDIVDKMKRKIDGLYIIQTDYEKESEKADRDYSKSDNGYWSSECEMFARAFTCYVKDKLEEKGIRSDYLCGHSEATVKPVGEERKVINKAFDDLISELKERGLLRHQVHNFKTQNEKQPVKEIKQKLKISDFVNEKAEQLSLFDVIDNDDTPSDDFMTDTFIDLLMPEFQSVGFVSENERVLTMNAGTVNDLSESVQNVISEKSAFDGDKDLSSLFIEIFDNEECLTSGMYVKDDLNKRYDLKIDPKEESAIFEKVKNVLGHSVDQEFDRLYDMETDAKTVEYDDF